MAVVFQRNEIGLECNNVIKTVPDNDVARLMYYLNAVCYTIECDNDPDIQRFGDFQNWASLSFDEQKALLIACYGFSPDILNNRVFFHNAALCGEYTNSFYTVNQVRSQLYNCNRIDCYRWSSARC